jgi:penicillin-binding protein 2
MTPEHDLPGSSAGSAGDSSASSRRNVRWLMIGFLCALATMVVILVLYQLVGSREAEALYTRQTKRRANLPAERGALLSCEGEILVWSRPVCRFVLDVRSMRHPREKLDLTVDRIRALLARFSQRFESGPMSQPMDRSSIRERLLDRGPMEFQLNDKWDVSVKDEQQYARFKDDFPQISLEYRFRRECTIAGPLVNTLGRVGWKHPDEDPKKPLWYRRDEMVGVSGLEAALNPVICGLGGTEEILVDAFALHRVGTLERVEPIAGRSVKLTIQMPIQRLAEATFLETGHGAFIVMEVESGKVRALGGTPFAPYSYTAKEMEGLEKGALQDRTRGWVPPPGSVFKPITICAALMSGAITPAFTAFCDGKASTGQNCEGHHGDTDLVTCLARSCNVCAFEVGRRAGHELVTAWAKRFGIGNDPRRSMYGLRVTASRVSSPETWYPGEVFALAIGKGSTGASITSLAVYCRALYTDEVAAPVYVEEESLPKALRDKLPPRDVRTVGLADDVRKLILDGMLECVESAHGTGRKAHIRGLKIYGKTGTAALADGTKNATMMALVCDGETPKYTIVCTIENSDKHGGSDVGPRLRKFLEGMLAQGYLSSNAKNGGE